MSGLRGTRQKQVPVVNKAFELIRNHSNTCAVEFVTQ